MQTSCNDAAFGVMQYKHRWIKRQTISAFGKDNKDQFKKCMDEIVKRNPNILIGYTPENIAAMNK